MPTQAEVDALALSLTLQLRLALRTRPGSSAPPSRRTFTDADAHALATRFGGRDPGLQALVQTLQHIDAEIDRYESQSLHTKALDLIPFDTLHDRACRLQETRTDLDFQDCLAHVLVEWAKNDFLKWVDPVLCSTCGGTTAGVGGDVPTLTERDEGGAGRVELYQCSTCGAVTRFPRYGKLEKLLETRTGRCGEYAAVFMLLLRALGLRARYVWNSEDHVWNEYYSEHLKRWVHLDSCEGARDKNLLYDRGWGKKMKYCIAFSSDGARDVTSTYVSDMPAALPRRNRAWEGPLHSELLSITKRRRTVLSKDEQESLAAEDRLEEDWLRNSQARAAAADRETLSGRTSGTKEWREQRSESGKQSMPPATLHKRILSSSESQPALSGSAASVGTEIRLTDDKPDQTGSAFFQLPAEVAQFTAAFAFRVSKQGDTGADGLAFVVHQSGSVGICGRGGCDLGYGGIERSFAIEIDTYRSVDRCNDLPTPHISIHTRGSLPNEGHHRSSIFCTPPASLPDLDDGREYWLRIELRGHRELRVWFSDKADQTSFVELTSGPVSLPAFLDSTKPLFLGWTASTGGLHQAHHITQFEVWELQTSVESDIAKDSIT